MLESQRSGIGARADWDPRNLLAVGFAQCRLRADSPVQGEGVEPPQREAGGLQPLGLTNDRCPCKMEEELAITPSTIPSSTRLRVSDLRDDPLPSPLEESNLCSRVRSAAL